MGTRNLTCVVVDNIIKVAQYGQWDGNPEGQGTTIYEFLQECDLTDFRNKVRTLTEITPKNIKDAWIKCGAEPDAEWVSTEVAEKMKEIYPHLSRDIGAEILSIIANDQAKEVKLSTDFAADSLFCEWAYVLDLDNNVLEVYKGFQHNPHTKGRFANLGNLDNNTGPYYPVALVKSFSISDLPKTTYDFCHQIYEACPKEED